MKLGESLCGISSYRDSIPSTFITIVHLIVCTVMRDTLMIMRDTLMEDTENKAPGVSRSSCATSSREARTASGVASRRPKWMRVRSHDVEIIVI